MFLNRIRQLPAIWIVPVVVLPIVGATLVWGAYDEYETTLEQEYRFLEAHARIADGNLAGVLRTTKQLLERIAEERPSIPPSRLASYETVLVRRKTEVPEIRTLAVVDASGRVEATANPSLRGFDSSKRDYFTVHRERELTPNFGITPPFKSSFGDYSVVFSVAMRDDQRRLTGVVVAGSNYKFFDSVMTPIKPQGGNSTIGIVNMQGDIIYRLPDPEKYAGVNVSGSPQFQQFLRAGRMTRSMGVARTDGVKRMYVYRAIGTSGLGVVVTRPVDEVLAGWRRNAVSRGLIFVFAAAVTLSLAFFAHRRQREASAGKLLSDQLIATANVMLVGLDTRGRITIFNEAAEQISGYRRDEVLGRSWFDVLVPTDRFPNVKEIFRKSQEEGTYPRTFENPILNKAGEERIIAWQNGEVRQNGVLLYMISFGIDITERRQFEAAKRNEEISRRLVSVQEEERRRLAVELHDRTSPNLCALKINLRVIEDSLPAGLSASFDDLLQDTSALLEDTIASIKTISTDHRPPLLDHAGLWPALRGYALAFSRRTGIAVHADNIGCDMRLAPDIEINLFRIAQEALTNCAKHSRAKTIRLEQTRVGDIVRLAIADDGVGFDCGALYQGEQAPGHGLTTMRRRAEFMGGKFSLDSAPGAGTRIAVEVAVADAAVSAAAVIDGLQPVAAAS